MVSVAVYSLNEHLLDWIISLLLDLWCEFKSLPCHFFFLGMIAVFRAWSVLQSSRKSAQARLLIGVKTIRKSISKGMDSTVVAYSSDEIRQSQGKTLIPITICVHLTDNVEWNSAYHKVLLIRSTSISGLPGEISIISDMQMIPPLWQKVKKN